MSEKLNVSIILKDWELEAFQRFCDEQGWLMEIMLEQFVKWCVKDGERAILLTPPMIVSITFLL